MTTVSLRFDDDMKRELDEMCEEMGMNITTFFTIYAKKALRERRIPFDIEAPVKPDATESALDDADNYAKTYSQRMTREEIFGGLRSRVNDRK